ncbi:3-hydroxyacyl-CoA dehydrogenase NAD-binding domain-containing protein [Microbulbifer celer]|uniref:3-hydroxyacyl-CoA dehydrogenase NAD-binding domain-containing protein n=1 Tax=Microbulbifer celer TaxID=435905 RepID=A0ABW3U9W2_9GAMM|nr:3-hydroxyacyl-CoA dehydrogenase NAD-binding domain-containing protein [Microbulbifer celer]UFN58346.1 3-hydroxyacyl-CoA dehydrogenase NAD-binding domain-containing protein [Microbulbifer celer]
MSVVDYEIRNQIGIVRLNNPPVNALSQALRAGILAAVERAQTDESRAILIICEGRTFVAGADISEFNQPPVLPTLPDVVAGIEQSQKPVIAALHGTALGGGLELALACHYRCALPSAKVGLPEVKLGLLPGAGGTQYLPRLAGVEAALELITSGNPVSAQRAHTLGVIDAVLDDEKSPVTPLDNAAIAYAQTLLSQSAPLRRVRDIEIPPDTVSENYFHKAREQLARRYRGQPAPQLIADCIQAAVEKPIDAGLALERMHFERCLHSSESAAMRHLFFAERQCTKVVGLAKDVTAKPVRSVGIIGGGTMGGGIAMNFANAGIPVRMLEINDEAMARGLAIVQRNYAASVKKGRLTQESMDRAMACIQGTTDYAELSQVDLVIEAVFENLEIKQQVFRKLDEVCKPGAILASNTSYQDLDAIAAVTRRPEDVIGLHFFSPANVMKLLEVVRGAQTSDSVLATAMQLARAIGKVPVLSRVCYGFIGNRMLNQYFRQAHLCLMEGATPAQIDGAMESWGMAMGPLAVGDLSGLDIGYKARQAEPDNPDHQRVYCLPDALVEMGRLGQKTGAGYYRYDPETRAREEDAEVLALARKLAAERGVTPRSLSDEEIRNRLLLALVNEGARILEEGVAQRASDIDVVYANGYGFPRYRGGPMYFADQLGGEAVLVRLRGLYAETGDPCWKPAALIESLAATGKNFTDEVMA